MKRRYEIGTRYIVPHYGLMVAGVPKRSTRKNKKLMVFVKSGNREKVIHFGQRGYEDYTGHRDPKRRAAYLKRTASIRNGQGRLTRNDPFSANYWARKVLW